MSTSKENVEMPPFILGQAPIGAVTMYAGTKDEDWLAQQGWMICDGRGLDMDKYNHLYSSIRGAYGQDGSKFFIPDCRGMFVRGVNDGSGNDPDAATREEANVGGNKGDKIGSKQWYEIQSHTHSFSAWMPDGFGLDDSGDDWKPPHAYTSDNNTVSVGGAETRPRNIYMFYIIKFDNVK